MCFAHCISRFWHCISHREGVRYIHLFSKQMSSRYHYLRYSLKMFAKYYWIPLSPLTELARRVLAYVWLCLYLCLLSLSLCFKLSLFLCVSSFISLNRPMSFFSFCAFKKNLPPCLLHWVSLFLLLGLQKIFPWDSPANIILCELHSFAKPFTAWRCSISKSSFFFVLTEHHTSPSL